MSSRTVHTVEVIPWCTSSRPTSDQYRPTSSVVGSTRSTPKSIWRAHSRALWRVPELFAAFSEDIRGPSLFYLSRRLSPFYLLMKINNFDSSHRCFVTLVARLYARPVDRLLDRVRR